jgi:transposase
MKETLFPLGEPVEKTEKDERRGEPRVLRPERNQVEMVVRDLESTLPADHVARIVWDFAQGLGLGPLYAEIKSVEGHAGRPQSDPRVYLALWMLAVVDGVGSARKVAELCERHDAYRWLRGKVPVNYHTLSDFRVEHGAVMDELLTQSVACLMSEGLVTLNRVAQDGVRIRASAGAASFRREETLRRCLEEAKAQVEALKRETHDDPAAASRREAAARKRAAEDRVRRVTAALAHLPDVASKKKGTAEEKKEKARVSTTDPEARVMKMADGGFRPAFNGQFATDAGSLVIVGVDVSNSGSDAGKLPPMLDQIKGRYGRMPGETLVDGGFAGHRDIEAATLRGTRVYAPVQKPKDAGRDPHEPLPDDSAVIAEWRQRMGTAVAKQLYKDRAATAECANADARNHGLQRFTVRGEKKARCVLVLHALAHNMMRALSLRTQARSGSLALAVATA